MYALLLRLMLLAALIELGFGVRDLTMCGSRSCTARIERASRAVLTVDWKPISVWPEEAKRLRHLGKNREP